MGADDTLGREPGLFSRSDRFQRPTFLGRGSMGLVYRVHDVEMGTEVALKTLLTRDPDKLYGLKHEFRVLTGIVHPNLVELYELLVDDWQSLFTMEFVEGINVVEYIRAGARAGLVDPARVIDALEQLVSGLAHVHAAGRLHRDIKPSNILVTRDARIVLLDFGLATALEWDTGPNTPADLAGTFAYMAPEQGWSASLTPAVDFYAVGVVLFEALTGRLPFVGHPTQLLLDKRTQPAPTVRSLVPDLPDALDTLVTALLNPDPAERPSAEQILADLQTQVSAGQRPVRRPVTALAATPFVGRAESLAALRTAYAAIGRDRAEVVQLRGPSGIGKTELVRRFLEIVGDDPEALVFRGRCHHQETVPYKALDTIIDSLSRWLMSLPDRTTAMLVPRDAGALLRLFPVLASVPSLASHLDSVTGDDPQEIRRRGALALRDLLAQLATRYRLVVWIDDLQWGDLDSAALLREILRPPDAPSLLLILSFRSEDTTASPMLSKLAETTEQLPNGAVHDLVLGPLGDLETRDLAELLCTWDTARLVNQIATESGGSPLFLSQLARHSATTGTTPVGGLRLATVISERVALLPATARELLEVVAVAGRPLERGIALEAAGIRARGRPALIGLEQDRLLRSTGGRATVEVYHDRVREVVLETLASERRRHCHRQLADIFQQLPAPDPQELFTHYLGAGETNVAGRYAEQAADLAAHTLAFDRAAQLYRQALALQGSAANTVDLRYKLAQALANAGLSQDAGVAFEAAAAALAQRSAAETGVLDLKGRAAEQYLRGGLVTEGTTLLRAVLADLDVTLPTTSRRALFESIRRRVQFWVRGPRFTRQAAHLIAPRVLARLDACRGAAYSMGFLNPLLGDVLGLHYLLGCLEAGEPSRLAFALSHESTREASLGGKLLRKNADRLLELAYQLAEEIGDPSLQAHYYRGVGMNAYFYTQWRDALEACDTACRIWREQCPAGSSWEAMTTASFSLSALAQMGELRELGRRLPAVIGDADARGNAYAATSIRMGVPAMAWLAQDRAGPSRDIADTMIAPWPTDTFLVQHYLHLIATVQADLYLGNAWRAWQAILDAWPKLVKARIMVAASTRLELLNLRARTAVAAATDDGSDPAPDRATLRSQWSRTRLLRSATRDARRMARIGLQSATPLATLLRAEIAVIKGQPAVALPLLGNAAERFERIDMRLHAAAARWVAGILRGDALGRQLREESERWAREQDIRVPERMLSVVCPIARTV